MSSWDQIKNGIFAGESGGDYNALFGYSNRDGGPFADRKLTDMTVDEAIAFSSTSGPYAQWVRGKIGRVATPMGAYQIVGTTLRAAKQQMGLDGSERMDEATQDKIGQWIYKTQGTGAWEGYKGPMDSYSPSSGGVYSGGDGTETAIGGAGIDYLSNFPQLDEAESKKLYDAYLNGEMSPQQAFEFRSLVAAGKIIPPSQPTISGDDAKKLYDAFTSGQMNEEQANYYQDSLDLGIIQKVEPQQEEPGFLSEFGRGLALSGRSIAQGAAGLAGIVLDPITAGGAMLSGQDVPAPYRERMGQALTDLGVPQPQTGAERVLSMATEGAAGGLTGAGLAGAAARGISGAAPTVAGRVTQALAAQPVAQAVGGATAGASSQIAQEAGAPPIVQIGAGLAGGIVGGGLTGAALREPMAPQMQAQRVEPTMTRAATEVTPSQELAQADTLFARARGGSREAVAQISDMAQINPEARASAERLGLELPVDVFAESRAVKEAIGIIRAQRGTEASAAWADAVERASSRADDVMEQIDATPDLSSISDRVGRSLDEARQGLKAEADRLYSMADEGVDKSAVVQTSNVDGVLLRNIDELGGIESFTPAEKSLYAMVNREAGVTYAALMREKRQIGAAIERRQGPYADADTALLKQLYGAMAEDQVAAVSAMAGEDAANAVKLANATYAQKMALEDQIVKAFGQDLQGSIAGKLRTAITQAGKGDTANFSRIMQIVPEGLRREATLTAISALSRSSRGVTSGQFGFAEFTKFYGALRNNSVAYKQVRDAIGPEADRVLRDLYEVSKRITQSRELVPQTGLANQANFPKMFADGILTKVINSRAGQSVRTGVGGMAGSAALGPLGAGIGAALASMPLGKGRVDALSSLLQSPKFQSMMIEAANKAAVSGPTARRLIASPEYRKWAKVNAIANPESWLFGVISGTANAKPKGEAQ